MSRNECLCLWFGLGVGKQAVVSDAARQGRQDILKPQATTPTMCAERDTQALDVTTAKPVKHT